MGNASSRPPSTASHATPSSTTTARAPARGETPAEPDDLVTRIDAGGDSGQDPNCDGPRQELARCLAPLIRQLPEPYREALTLTDLGKLSQVEAAEVVGLSVPG